MSEIGYFVKGDTKLAIKFEHFPQQVHDRLLERITSLTRRLEAMVLAAVPRKTGKLESEIRSFVDDSENKISGKVKVVLPKGSAEVPALLKAMTLEYGSTRKPFDVTAHFQHLYGARQEVFVKAYKRAGNVAATRFMRGPAAALRDTAMQELRAAVDQAIEE